MPDHIADTRKKVDLSTLPERIYYVLKHPQSEAYPWWTGRDVEIVAAYAAEQQALKEKAEAVAAENAEHFLARIAELEALYQRQVKKHADDFDELSQGYLARAEKAEARADALDDELELLVARAEKAEADSQHLCGKLNSALARVAGLEGEVARLKDLEKARWVKVPLFMKIRHCAKCDSYHALDADCPPPMILRGPEVR